MSFSNSFFSRGGPSAKRPMLLIEPPYKINGEDKSKPQTRTLRVKDEQDSRGTGQPTAEQKTAEKVRDLNTKETSKSGNKTEGKVTSELDSKADDKFGAENSVSIPNLGVENRENVTTYSEAKAVGSAAGENSLKNSEKIQQNVDGEMHSINDKISSSGANSQSKQVEKSTSVEPSKSMSSTLEENIVLGVALEGSKRTLPIEEEFDSSPTPAPSEEKELAARNRGHGNLAAEKDERTKRIREWFLGWVAGIRTTLLLQHNSLSFAAALCKLLKK